jgi:putative DeoR family transcriptional regulator (stage III sporulation protein D)
MEGLFMSFLEQTRQELLADYVIETGATVRQAAIHFGVSKSTVHKDLTDRLRISNKALYDEVKKILYKNKSERHIRGGEATRKKYLKNKKTKK